MKVISGKEMARIEHLAYDDGADEEEFMEAAGRGIASVVWKKMKRHALGKAITLLVGKGNNGGDAYVAGCYLLAEGYDVKAVQLVPLDDASRLCKKNAHRFKNEGGVILDDLPPHTDLFIDGIFGTGFHGEVKAPYIELIERVNRNSTPVLAIDIPSGLDANTGFVGGVAIKASDTVFLELPKLGFFLHDAWDYVGQLHLIRFGLADKYIDQAEAEFEMGLDSEMRSLLPPIKRTRHKYSAGYVMGLGGSPGMPGAALLASLATLRGGAGIVKLLHPEKMREELALSFPELIKLPYKNTGQVIDAINEASAAFIGPGLGQEEATKNLVHEVLQAIDVPAVIDADALNIIAKDDKIVAPAGSILTPHSGEMHRLLGKTEKEPLSEQFLRECRAFSEDQGVTILLKGGPSFIFHKGMRTRISPKGCPGMATAGSGDVLTGLIAALLAQGMRSYEAALLGAYVHGLAGEIASSFKSDYSMIASDIIEAIPHAYLSLATA